MPIFFPDGREAKTMAEMREALPSVPSNECFGCYLGDCAPEMHDRPEVCEYAGGFVYTLRDPATDSDVTIYGAGCK